MLGKFNVNDENIQDNDGDRKTRHGSENKSQDCPEIIPKTVFPGRHKDAQAHPNHRGNQRGIAQPAEGSWAGGRQLTSHIFAIGKGVAEFTFGDHLLDPHEKLGRGRFIQAILLAHDLGSPLGFFAVERLDQADIVGIGWQSLRVAA